MIPPASDPSIVRALVFAGGDFNGGPAVQAALEAARGALVVAADSGARLALACGLTPHLVVGDLDSLRADEVADLRARGVEIDQHPAHKDETDLELALIAACARGATWLRLIGAVGDRLDQTLANIALLTLPDLIGRETRLVSGRQTLWLLRPGVHALRGDPGDTISLIAFVPGVTGITTEGLEYPLTHEALAFGPARGVSNVMLRREASVRFEAGLVIAVHTPGRA